MPDRPVASGHDAPMSYEGTISNVVKVVEGVGVAVMVVGGTVALAAAVVAVLDPTRRSSAYQGLRRNLGRVILLGLEILIIGDIVRTVVVEPTVDGVLVLGIIVLIRIVLSVALEVEIDGRWPWSQRRDPAPP
jgi:uncharacterized membrane protein